MINLFFEELAGAVVQLLLFSLIPFIWWQIFAIKKESYFKWIGIKKMVHEKRIGNTLLITVLAVAGYTVLTTLCIKMVSDGITTAGSLFAGKGFIAIPAALAYGYIRTGLSEEIVFRGFLLKRTMNKFGFGAGNLLQAILFGLLHGIPFGLATHNIAVTVLLTILPGVFGWFQGWLNEKRCGGSIVSSWLLHGTMNFIVACLGL